MLVIVINIFTILIVYIVGNLKERKERGVMIFSIDKRLFSDFFLMFFKKERSYFLRLK